MATTPGSSRFTVIRGTRAAPTPTATIDCTVACAFVRKDEARLDALRPQGRLEALLSPPRSVSYVGQPREVLAVRGIRPAAQRRAARHDEDVRVAPKLGVRERAGEEGQLEERDVQGPSASASKSGSSTSSSWSSTVLSGRPEPSLPFATDLVGALPGVIAEIAQQVDTGQHGGDEANLEMQAVYLDHVIDVSRARGVDATLPAYVKRLMDKAISAGHGANDLASLSDEFTPSS